MFRVKFFASFILVALLALSGCNLPSNAPKTEQPDVIQTNAALTVEALLNQPTPFNTPTIPAAPPTNTVAPPTIAPPTATSQPLPSATPNCDLAQFVKDVTVPDGSIFNPGDTFTKTWRLRNIGTCTWSGYALVFDSGDAMSGASPLSIGTVNPGQEVDVSVNLKAPSSNGTYRGYWRIRNGSGVLIPVQGGAQQNKSFFVEIKVGVFSSGFDLYSQAPSAQWISCGSPCGGGTTLTFGGPDTDANGFALYRSGATLEDGSSPTKVLETHPMWVNDGVITGLYPSYTVKPDEHFKAKIGFLGPCGSGNVVFQFNYKEAGSIFPLGSWTDSCDGNLISVDVNLNSIAGKNVQFVLGVLANGSSGQDWAVWVNPTISIP